MSAAGLKVGVMGAGAIGCYLGGRLAAAGCDVVLVGRPALAAEIAAHGLHVTDYRGFDKRLTVPVATEAGALRGRDVVLVTVKSGDTAAAATTLAEVVGHDAVVVSFQNGVGNPDILRAAGLRVLAGMVPFNVLRRDGAHVHQGTSGQLAIERGGVSARLTAALVSAGLDTRQHDDMQGVQWGKLLVNLNNAINALAGVPIKDMLGTRGYRRVMAACLREGLAAVRRAGIEPWLETKLPPRLLPFLLSLPDVLFARVARSMLTVDAEARSSMWDDLQRGRRTEIDALNGEVVRLAERVGGAAPTNAAIVALIKQAEAAGKGSPRLSVDALRAALPR